MIDETIQKHSISYEDFSKLDIRVATVIACESIEGADRLLKVTLEVGELGERTVAAGIKQWYQPEEMVGKTVIYLANLEPRVLRGVTSQGMILAAGGDEAVLLQPEKSVSVGTVVR